MILLSELKKYEGQYFTASNSNAGKWLHYKIISVEQGILKTELTIRNDMINPVGNIHGGVMALYIDEMCGLAFVTLGLPTYYTTLNLSIDYLYSAALHETIHAKATVLRSGKRVGNIECSVYNEHNTLLAHATTNLVNTDKSTPLPKTQI